MGFFHVSVSFKVASSLVTEQMPFSKMYTSLRSEAPKEYLLSSSTSWFSLMVMNLIQSH